eukprot:scaffold3202_cov407-Prasinococcus_capsulatus_cf.AAC.6
MAVLTICVAGRAMSDRDACDHGKFNNNTLLRRSCPAQSGLSLSSTVEALLPLPSLLTDARGTTLRGCARWHLCTPGTKAAAGATAVVTIWVPSRKTTGAGPCATVIHSVPHQWGPPSVLVRSSCSKATPHRRAPANRSCGSWPSPVKSARSCAASAAAARALPAAAVARPWMARPARRRRAGRAGARDYMGLHNHRTSALGI